MPLANPQSPAASALIGAPSALTSISYTALSPPVFASSPYDFYSTHLVFASSHLASHLVLYLVLHHKAQTATDDDLTICRSKGATDWYYN